ncbi:dephospho-CoA kinase [Streptomyces sp. NPDC001876]|uniref:dephospho-CoA kinase n=1 Tax=Streptomyces sp. NPDC001876 TaxID=3154402 RepID=UPI00332AE31C
MPPVPRRRVTTAAVLSAPPRSALSVAPPAPPAPHAVVEAFGPGILTPQGTLDRPALGAIVFADPERLAALNAIVHPLVGARSAELERAAGPDAVVVHDVPLLTENGLAPLYDLVVVVDATPGTQLDRLVTLRGMTESDARARMAAQATREERKAVADLVVDNDGPLEALEPQVRALWSELTARAAGG